jgi:hypothetical protein
MWNLLKTRGVALAIATIGLTVLMTGPAWAVGITVPGPAAGGLAGAAIIGAIVVAKWWRRK